MTAHSLVLRHAVALPVLAIALLATASPAFAKAGLKSAKPVAAASIPASAGDDDKVAQALARGDINTAQALAEAAVARSPRESGLRLVLGRVYLRAGRFESAAGMLADARSLGDTGGRTALGLALAQIACGRGADAVALLDGAHDTIPVADYGLALAMAGAAPRGVAILGDALHSGDQSPKLRQNLAYAYALDGRWGEARMMAAMDTPAEKLDARLSQWAETAQPDAVRRRVANLIGVPLRDDPGVPLSLALANIPAMTASQSALAQASVPAVAAEAAQPQTVVADAAPPSVGPSAGQTYGQPSPQTANVPAPTELAVKTDSNGELPPVDHTSAPAQASAVATASLPATVVLHRADTTRLVGVAVAHADVVAARHARHHGPDHAALAASVEARPQTVAPADAQKVAVAGSGSQPVASAPPLAVSASAPTHSHKGHAHKDVAVAEAAPAATPASIPAPATSGAATHLVQLGSFSSQQNAEHARQTFVARDPSLSHRQFVITQALVNGRNFWRVAVMGFDATSAGQACSAIRHHGGACFAYAAGHLPGGQTLAVAAPPKQDHLAHR